MVTLDQVLLLQKKVETAVAKIRDLTSQVQQLNSDNDALRRKCAELTKALSDKSELVTSLENEQDKIESSIINALKELDVVEDSILGNATSSEAEETVSENKVAEAENTAEAVEEEEKVIDYSSSATTVETEQKETTDSVSNETGSLFEKADEINATATNEASVNSQFDIF